MINELINKPIEEAKTVIDSMTDAQRLDFIKEVNTLKEQKQQEKAKVEAELKLTQENLESELASLKTNFGINSLEELEEAVKTKTESINNELLDLVKAMKGE